MRRIAALEPEDVQAYPRPPSLEAVALPVRVVLGGEVIVDAADALRVCETHHAPTYYVAPDAVRAGVLQPAAGSSYCEWKGIAAYWNVQGGGQSRARAAWSYPDPTPAFLDLGDYVAFYSAQMDACFVGGVQVTPQPGDFYGGWVTPNLSGTVKGAPGTRGW